MREQIDRRQFHISTLGGAAALAAGRLSAETSSATRKPPFKLKYILASCMYGTARLAEILPEVAKTGAGHIEIWAKPHGSQREQIDEMGADAFSDLLKKHNVTLGSFTCFKYGVFKMQSEMALVKRLGGDMVICNSGGPRGLKGDELKTAVRKFAEKLRPHVDAAGEHGVVFGLENHSGSLVNSRDTQLRLMDLIDVDHFGIALAPYHLPQDEKLIAGLIETLGKRLVHFQAWEHGMGCAANLDLTTEEQLQQMPGRGGLDFTPLVAALEKINYTGRVEIFMHPIPRGVPILPTIEQVTAEINRGRQYLEQCHETVKKAKS